jgi:hypothetical protein
MTLSRALFLKLTKQYLRLDYRLTLLEIQKIAYFLQESGEPLHLRYEKGFYGPYAPNLNNLLEVMEGHYIRGYGDSQKPDVKIRVINSAVEEADKFLLIHHLGINDNLERVTRLIAGFETPYGVELLASIHWLATHTIPPVKTADDAIREMGNWSARKKRMFKPQHIKTCWERLVAEGWINPE